MDLQWEHQLLGMWHPGVLAAVTIATVLAWFIGAATVRGVVRVLDPWRRIVYLSVPILLVGVFVLVLPALLFYAGWFLTHPRYITADLFMARRLLLLPFFVAVASALRQVAPQRPPN